MKVAIVCTGLGQGGAETQIVALASSLQARGHHIVVHTLFSGTARVQELRKRGVTVTEHQKRTRLDLRLLRRLYADMRAERVELVHGFLFDGNLYARLAGTCLGLPVICSERSSAYTLRPAQAAVHRLTRRMTRAVVANSHAGAQLAGEMYPHLAATDIQVVWNGIDGSRAQRARQIVPTLRAKLGIPQGERVLIFVGALKPEKDVELAIAVASRLASDTVRPWHLVLVGAAYPAMAAHRVREFEQSAQYARAVEQAIERAGLMRLHRAGQVEDAIDLIAQADVLLSTSRREGFPNVVLEAMAVGVPVVSTRYSDIAQILPFDWQVVASRDPAELARAVGRASREREVVANAQNRWVQDNATLDVATSRLEDVYRRHARTA